MADRHAFRAAARLLQARGEPSGPLLHLYTIYFPKSPERGGGGSGVGGVEHDLHMLATTPVTPTITGTTATTLGRRHPMPTLRALQTLSVLQHLMSLLFNPTRQLPLQDQQRARRLLALACAGEQIGGGAGTTTTTTTTTATAGVKGLESEVGVGGGGNLPLSPTPTPDDGEIEEGEISFAMTVSEAERMLEKGAQVAKMAIKGTTPNEYDLGIASILPASCTGMVHAMMWHIDTTGRDFLPTSVVRAMVTTGAAILSAQPHLAAHVLEVFRDLAAAQACESGTLILVLDIVVRVLTERHATLALGWLSDFARLADPERAQRALYAVLTRCGPPYSTEFAATALDLLRASGVEGPGDAGCTPGSVWSRLLMEMADHMRDDLFRSDAIRSALGEDRVADCLEQLWILRKSAGLDDENM